MSKGNKYYVYILQCSDGSYYTGYAEDIEARVKRHNEGKGGKYTNVRRPVRLLYSEPCKDKQSAIKREQQLKHWSRPKKEALINGDVKLLKQLSKKKKKTQ